MFGRRITPAPRIRQWFAAALCAATLLLRPGTAHAAADAAYGLWWNEARTVQVEIGPCVDGLCGKIVWLREPLDAEGRPKLDHRNADRSRRDQPMMGLEVLHGLKAHASRDDTWTGGTAYDANRGRTYRCIVTMRGPDEAIVRGYIGFSWFGRTEHWARVAPEDPTG